MQICPVCGKGIKFISTGYNDFIICDSNITTVYTERGRKLEGYTQHKCKECENGKTKENI